MEEADRAVMLGIRHRCGQEVQFWIPAHVIASLVPSLGDPETRGLTSWMREEGLLDREPEAPVPPQELMGQLKSGLGERDVALIDVEKDTSVCPSCGALIPWLDALVEYARGQENN
jgi:hypothetical protein